MIRMVNFLLNHVDDLQHLRYLVQMSKANVFVCLMVVELAKLRTL